MRIKRETAPGFAHAESEYQAGQYRDNPCDGPEEATGRDVYRLLIYEDRAGVKREASEPALDQPQAATQNQQRQHKEDRKQLDLQSEHVPVDRGIPERAKPKRGNVN